MQYNGQSYPIIPYDLILDTDIGLYQLINARYKKSDVFGTGILEAPVAVQKYFLLNRFYVNPLRAIAFNPDDEETLNDYYKEFMDQEIHYILNHSVTTQLYAMLKNAMEEKNVHISIWCPTDFIADHIRRADPDVMGKLNIRVSKKFSKSFDDFSEPAYLKDYKDTIFCHDVLDGKNIYLATYRFNYEDDEKQNLLSDVSTVIGPSIRITEYEPYTKEDFEAIS